MSCYRLLSRMQRLHPIGIVASVLSGILLLFTPCALLAQQPAGWLGYSGNAQHTGISVVAAQPLQGIHWSTPVDTIFAHYSGTIYAHYGSPLITPRNTVIVTVRTSNNDTFMVQGICGYCGQVLWSQNTDYTTPPHGWIPSCGSTLAPNNTLFVPAAGGTVMHIGKIDSNQVVTRRAVFYGKDKYNADPNTYNSNVQISTPITCDRAGNIYFGFTVGGATSANLSSGLARIALNGAGSWVAASTAANDNNIIKVATNCAPAISNDGKIVYVAVNGNGDANNAQPGYLLALDSTTLATVGKVRLKDAQSGLDANIIDDGTATPTVGPDDDVFYGVLEIPWYSNGDRGWLLHFDKMLTTQKATGAFGWDDTGTVVPAKAVPSYTGTSSYLLLTKYNNYADGLGGDGHNRVAVLDPHATMADPRTGVTVMNEVISVLGVTPDPENSGVPGAVREWCINSAAIDPGTKSAIINSEDGTVYRWNFISNSLSEKVVLTPGVGEAYTPTVIGPDGTAYAINDAVLFAVGSNSPDITGAVSVTRSCMEPTQTPNVMAETIRVTNISGCTLSGPISLVINNLSMNAVLLNASGVTTNVAPLGSPYITLNTGGLQPGSVFTVTLRFKNTPAFMPIFYTTRVVAGPANP
jgi:hypothetical protein